MLKHPWLLSAMITAASMVYAFTRYVIFSDVALAQVPLFVTNKAVSMAGVAVVGLASFGRQHHERRLLGLIGFALVGVHVLVSLQLSHPAYYSKLYLAGGQMSMRGELAMLLGVLACVPLVWLLFKTPRAAIRSEKPAGRSRSLVPWLGRALLLLTAGHVAAIGAPGWTAFETWPGRLPPITLLSFLLATGLVVGAMLRQRRRRSR